MITKDCQHDISWKYWMLDFLFIYNAVFSRKSWTLLSNKIKCSPVAVHVWWPVAASFDFYLHFRKWSRRYQTCLSWFYEELIGSGFVILIVYYNLYFVKTGLNHGRPLVLVFLSSHLFMSVSFRMTYCSINYILQSALTKDGLVASGGGMLAIVLWGGFGPVFNQSTLVQGQLVSMSPCLCSH